jgi:hypothetical protein
MLCRTGTVDEFSKHFIALSCRDMTLSEVQQLQLFITSLGDPLRTDVALQQLATLDGVVIFARAYVQRNMSRKTTPAGSGRSFGHSASRLSATVSGQASTPALAASSPSVAKSSMASLRLSPIEIAQRHKDEFLPMAIVSSASSCLSSRWSTKTRSLQETTSVTPRSPCMLSQASSPAPATPCRSSSTSTGRISWPCLTQPPLITSSTNRPQRRPTSTLKQRDVYASLWRTATDSVTRAVVMPCTSWSTANTSTSTFTGSRSAPPTWFWGSSGWSPWVPSSRTSATARSRSSVRVARCGGQQRLQAQPWPLKVSSWMCCCRSLRASSRSQPGCHRNGQGRTEFISCLALFPWWFGHTVTPTPRRLSWRNNVMPC